MGSAEIEEGDTMCAPILGWVLIFLTLRTYI